MACAVFGSADVADCCSRRSSSAGCLARSCSGCRWLARERRAALDAAERLFWQVVISIALSLAVVLALAALGRYSFERLLIADVGAAIAARGRSPRSRLATRPRGAAARMVGAGAARAGPAWRSGASFHRRSTSSAGRIRACTSTKASRSRSAARCRAADPVVAAVPNFARDLFFPSEHRSDYYSGRFMGFFIQEPGAGTRHRAVPAPVPGIDCDRLRPRRSDREPAGRPACGPSSACSRCISRAHGWSGAQPPELRPVCWRCT